MGFNSGECVTFLNIANIHVLDVWGKRIFIGNNKIIFLAFFLFIPFATHLFSTPDTSSNLINQAPLFTELRLLQASNNQASSRLNQGSPNFFVRVPHKLSHNNSRA